MMLSVLNLRSRSVSASLAILMAVAVAGRCFLIDRELDATLPLRTATPDPVDDLDVLHQFRRPADAIAVLTGDLEPHADPQALAHRLLVAGQKDASGERVRVHRARRDLEVTGRREAERGR